MHPRPLLPLLSACVALAALVSGSLVGYAAIHHRDVGASGATASFYSPALGGRLNYLIQLPRDYKTTKERYPVIYFLHGLPAAPTEYENLAWVGDVLAHQQRQAILVIPQGSRSDTPDPEYHDWGPGQNWATAISRELPAVIDRHYRTIPNRSGRAIIGLSAGGYGAASLGLTNPTEFSVVESWSGYFEPTDPTGTHALNLGSPEANRAASIHAYARTLATQFNHYPTFFAFYIGHDDPSFVPDNTALNRQLTTRHVKHQYTTYPGGHNTSLWATQASIWLAMALNHLHPSTAEISSIQTSASRRSSTLRPHGPTSPRCASACPGRAACGCVSP